MAISDIPVINGPSYGGVIYGLDLKMNYSQEPSTLTLSIINENGNYETPILNRQVSVSFGTFLFQGIVWSYEINETAQERILSIVLKDNSVILDRYYVLLWQRGMFNDFGKKIRQVKEVDLSDELIVMPIRTGFSDISFKEVRLGKQYISRDVYSANNKFSNIIYIGNENFPNSFCEIPDTSYTLEDLKKAIGGIVQGVNFEAPYGYKATHEGSLRKVLQDWANECGVEFYWNFSRNRIETFISSHGINLNLPNINSVNLISKKENTSMEGTLVQYPISYTYTPKPKIQTLSEQQEIVYEITINPFPVSYFLKRNGTLQSLNLPKDEEGTTDDPNAAETNLWGNRTETEFLIAAFLNYINESLRDLYLCVEGLFHATGFRPLRTMNNKKISDLDPDGIVTYESRYTGNIIYSMSLEEKQMTIDFLKLKSPNDIKELQNIDDENLSNYIFWLGVKSDDINEKWKKIENDILQSYGSIYKYTIGTNYTSYYCTPNSFTTITTTVDPGPTEEEPLNADYNGGKIFKRGGKMSHEKEQAADLLDLNNEDNLVSLSKVQPRYIDIISSGLKDRIFPATAATTLLIVPKYRLAKKWLASFYTDISTGMNPMEETVFDKVDQGQTVSKCSQYDKTVQLGQCLTVKEEATQKEYQRIGKTEDQDQSNLKSGLKNSRAKKAKIQLFKKELEIYSPSYGPYAVIVSTKFESQFISAYQQDLKINFQQSSPNVLSDINSVANFIVIKDNVTDDQDDFGKKRSTPLPLTAPIVNKNPQKNITYTFVGEPKELNLSPEAGLSDLSISYSSEGFKTTVSYSSRPPERPPIDDFLRKIESQLNRKSFNAL